MSRCDKFTFCSDALQAAYVRGVPGERFATLYPPFDLDKFEAAVSAADTEIEHKDGPTVGFIGRLSEQKGVSVLLRAMTAVNRSIPSARLVYVGVGEQEATLRASAIEFGLDGNVEFVGFKPNVFECLRHMDVLVLPSRTESFGITALEAMAMGVPVVATAVGGLKEVVADGETGTLVPYGNSEELAEAVVDLLSDDRRRLDMGNRGRERAFSVFHPSKYTQTLENLYLQLYRERIAGAK
jgi:glycosyltransferase involved in cell wall biosynthesis